MDNANFFFYYLNLSKSFLMENGPGLNHWSFHDRRSSKHTNLRLYRLKNKGAKRNSIWIQPSCQAPYVYSLILNLTSLTNTESVWSCSLLLVSPLWSSSNKELGWGMNLNRQELPLIPTWHQETEMILD